MDVRDPLADLKAEIEATDKASADKEKPADEAEDELKADAEEEESDDEPAEKEEAPVEAKDEEDEKPKAKSSKAKFVPVARLNETEARRRIAERRADDLALQLAERDKKDGKVPTTEDERKQIVQQARAMARIEVLADSFLEAGYESYGKKEFDGISQTLADLGAPDNLVMIAIEATGSASAAARAIFSIGQVDPDEIEALFKASPIRLGAQLAKYAGTRRAKAEKDVEEEVAAKPKGKGVSKAPAPIKPLGNKSKIVDDEISDDLTEEQFTEKFDKMMSSPRRSAH